MNQEFTQEEKRMFAAIKSLENLLKGYNVWTYVRDGYLKVSGKYGLDFELYLNKYDYKISRVHVVPKDNPRVPSFDINEINTALNEIVQHIENENLKTPGAKYQKFADDFYLDIQVNRIRSLILDDSQKLSKNSFSKISNSEAIRNLTQDEIDKISEYYKFPQTTTIIDWVDCDTEKEYVGELDHIELISIMDYKVFGFTDKYNYSEIQDDSTFHPTGKSFTMEFNDDYFLDIRCNHLTFVEGFRECYEGGALLVIGNHKGITVMKIIQPFYKKSN